ncbi:MAG: cation:proton antiporter, partial [Myxococcota bacterium]
AIFGLGSTLPFGVIAGAVAGLILSFLFQSRAIPEGLENIFALGFVLALFQTTNAVFHESGVAAVTTAGVILSHSQLPERQDLHHFKEQLTAMLIGLLFVLLAADVRIADIRALGWSAVIAVAGVMLIVRPLSVAVGTFGSDLSIKQRTFIGWIGPRGIIAAAVASLFAGRLEQEGLPEGRALQALVFTIIAVTVLWAGVTGGMVARWLGLRRPEDTGWVILGVNDVSLAVAHALRAGGEDILMIEADPHAVFAAEQQGFRAIFANPFEKRTVARAQMSSRTGIMALTPSEETNYLFAQRARKQGNAKINLIALDSTDRGITEDMVERIEGEIWTGTAVTISKWMQRLRANQAIRQKWRVSEATEKLTSSVLKELIERELILPLALLRNGRASPVGSSTELTENDEIIVLVPADRNEEALASLQTRAFLRLG